MPMSSSFDPYESIAADSAALGDAADGNLTATVEHCPGWRMSDLVEHVRGVHEFWGQIVERRLADPAQPIRSPRPRDSELIPAFRVGAQRLVAILRAADPATSMWTWADQHNAGFVIRHQVQEAAVHRWDAERAIGRARPIAAAPAADSVDEFLSVSLGPQREGEPALAGPLVLAATDTDDSWTITPSADELTIKPGTTQPAEAVVAATASDLLLWLYGRRDLSELTLEGEPAVAACLRSYANTD
jgi:uncharacterized protein (TIGR03083 family)